MSAKKYVPNRLRGVLDEDDTKKSKSQSTKLSSFSSQTKGRKSRPWRIDAASWKQQLQERKAVYDNFALPEKHEEKEPSSHATKEGLEAIPLNILTSSTADGGQVETMLTPRKGGQVEIVYTSASATSSTLLSPQSSLTGDDESSNDRCTATSENPSSSCDSISSSSSPLKISAHRRPSPLSRNKTTSSSSPKRKGRKSPSRSPYRTKRIDIFKSNDDNENNEEWTSKYSDSGDSVEYNVDGVELMPSRSKDSNIGIVNGVPQIRKQRQKNEIFNPNARVRLLRHGDSDDTAESVGLPHDLNDGESSSDKPLNKSSMMEAVEEFIDPSSETTSLRKKSKSNFQWSSQITTEDDVDVHEENEETATQASIFVNRSADGEIYREYREYRDRPGRRRRQRPPPNTRMAQTVMPLSSPATSTTSTTGTIMGNSAFKNQSLRRHRTISDPRNVDNDTRLHNINTSTNRYSAVPDDLMKGDELSIRPVPSDEDMWMEKRRRSLRDDADTETTHSGDTDIKSMANDVMYGPSNSRKENIEEETAGNSSNIEESEKVFTENITGQQTSQSISQFQRKDVTMPQVPSEKREESSNNESCDLRDITSTKFSSPDPLQRARKSLLVSNLNRSVRSLLDVSSHSHPKEGNDTSNVSIVESSISKSIFVPLRSRRQDYSSECDSANETKNDSTKETQKDGTKERKGESVKQFPLNVLDDHGVYVSKYNKNGIYVPPNNETVLSVKKAWRTETNVDIYNELGAYVPHDNTVSPPKDISDNNIAESTDNCIMDKSFPSPTARTKRKDDTVESISTSLIETCNPDPDESVPSPPSATTLKVDLDEYALSPQSEITNMQKNSDKLQESTVNNKNGDDGDKEIVMDRNGRKDVFGSYEMVEETEVDSRSETYDPLKLSESNTVSKEQLQIESLAFEVDDVGDNLRVTPSLVDTIRADEGNELDSESDTRDKASITTINAFNFPDSEKEGIEKNDSSDGIDDNDCAVDEIDANRIRLISDLKRRVTLLYTGNQIIIESIGTSTGPDPLATIRQKMTARNQALRADVKDQLTDMVSNLNTDHHHVVESSGKAKSVKGKKWKERMAMKKIPKKYFDDAKYEEKSNLPQEYPANNKSFGDEEDSNSIHFRARANDSNDKEVVDSDDANIEEAVGHGDYAGHDREAEKDDQISSALDPTEGLENNDVEESDEIHRGSSHTLSIEPLQAIDTPVGKEAKVDEVEKLYHSPDIVDDDDDHFEKSKDEKDVFITDGTKGTTSEFLASKDAYDSTCDLAEKGKSFVVTKGVEKSNNLSIPDTAKEIIPHTYDREADYAEIAKSANILLVTKDPNKNDVAEINADGKHDKSSRAEELISISGESEEKNPDTNVCVADIAERANNANIMFIVKDPSKNDLVTSGASASGRSKDSFQPKNLHGLPIRNNFEAINPATSGNDSETMNDRQEQSAVPKIQNVNLNADNLLEANIGTLFDGFNITDSSNGKVQEGNELLVQSNEEDEEDTAIPSSDKGSRTSSLAIGDKNQGDVTNLPIAKDDNNIIQGLPPNKGKKWKDRLKKKKNKKSEKNWTGKVKDNSENGQDALENIAAVPTENLQETTLLSSPDSFGDDGAKIGDSKPRPSFNRNLSDLTAEEKQREVAEVNEVENEPSTKNVGKKSNKWKNRLAKIKGTKLENTKPTQHDVKRELPSATSDQGQILVDLKSPDIPMTMKAKALSNDAERGQLHTNVESLGVSGAAERVSSSKTADRSQTLNDSNSSGIIPQLNSESTQNNNSYSVVEPETPKEFHDTTVSNVTDANQNPSSSDNVKKEMSKFQNGTNVQDSKLQNLRQSFDVFDAFLQNGHPIQIDDESIYTELTIGQETFLQSDPHIVRRSEEEQSYMDFTVEESVQPSTMENNDVSKSPPKEQMMSPFMSNLLRSRMFQDATLSDPKMSMPKEQNHEKQNKLVGNPDENLKKFPTITVEDAFDDDMTQITMGSLEEDQNEKEDGDDDKFFDAESKPLPRSLSSKSIGRKSKKSSNSRKAESVSSHSSQLSCSEASKQRIVDILRKEVWSRQTDVVKTAIEELDTEAKNGIHHRAHIVRCGGVMTIMRAMEMNSDCEAIQIVSCSTLETLALDPQTQTAICEMQGISLIVRCMQVHFENIQLQEVACVALATICRQQEASTSKDTMKDAEEAVPTVLSCMTRYPANSRIQAKGFQAIANLCSGSHARERLGELSKAGGIMTLTMALQTPWENKNDQHEAISNLSILLRGITELNEEASSVPRGEETLQNFEQHGTTGVQERSEPMTQQYYDYAVDNETVTSYMEEIPNMPILSTMSVHGEEIPDLDQYPTMMSNLEWQNFGEDDLDAGRKESNDPTGASNASVQQNAMVGKKVANEEQCIVQ